MCKSKPIRWPFLRARCRILKKYPCPLYLPPTIFPAACPPQQLLILAEKTTVSATDHSCFSLTSTSFHSTKPRELVTSPTLPSLGCPANLASVPFSTLGVERVLSDKVRGTVLCRRLCCPPGEGPQTKQKQKERETRTQQHRGCFLAGGIALGKPTMHGQHWRRSFPSSSEVSWRISYPGLLSRCCPPPNPQITFLFFIDTTSPCLPPHTHTHRIGWLSAPKKMKNEPD